MRYLHILEIKSLSVALFSDIFSQSVGCLFVFGLLWKSLRVCLGPICLFLLLFLLPWETNLRKLCCALCQNILPVFFSRNFKGSCLQFQSFSRFYFNSVNGERECTNFIDLHAPWPTLTSKMIFRYSFEYQKITVAPKTRKWNSVFFVLLISAFFTESVRWCMEVTRPT